jgi:hypothetical protein
MGNQENDIQRERWEECMDKMRELKEKKKSSGKQFLEEAEPCEDAVSRKKIEKLKRWRLPYDTNTTIPKSDLFIKLTDIRDLPPVKPVACIAKVNFSKEDMQEIVDKKIKEIVEIKAIPLEKIKQARKEMDDLASHKVRPISFDQAVAIDMCIKILDKLMGSEEA